MRSLTSPHVGPIFLDASRFIYSLERIRPDINLDRKMLL